MYIFLFEFWDRTRVTIWKIQHWHSTELQPLRQPLPDGRILPCIIHTIRPWPPIHSAGELYIYIFSFLSLHFWFFIKVKLEVYRVSTVVIRYAHHGPIHKITNHIKRSRHISPVFCNGSAMIIYIHLIYTMHQPRL